MCHGNVLKCTWNDFPFLLSECEMQVVFCEFRMWAESFLLSCCIQTLWKVYCISWKTPVQLIPTIGSDNGCLNGGDHWKRAILIDMCNGVSWQGQFIKRVIHWRRDKIAAIFQITYLSAFSWMKVYEFRFKFHWSLFLGVQLTIFQHWSR